MKFLVDRMLGKLAKQLRMLGYDTVYFRGGDASELLRAGREQGRAILTRNERLHSDSPEDEILRVTEDRPALQLKNLIGRGYVSLDPRRLFSRCLLCNEFLSKIPRTEAEGQVPEFVLSQQEQFVQCSKCRRIYWKGSHQQKMEKWINELFQT